MKTTNEKLNQIYKGCDKIVDEFAFELNDPYILYEDGRYDLAKLILSIIEDD